MPFSGRKEEIEDEEMVHLGGPRGWEAAELTGLPVEFLKSSTRSVIPPKAIVEEAVTTMSSYRS